MKHRLIIVEGLPCSGKSTMSAFVSGLVGRWEAVCHVDEGTGDHPADYEFHALAPDGFAGGGERIVQLGGCSEEELKRLLPYKIYDGLPWETEMPLMLQKWRSFADTAEDHTVYVFNCVLLQNPMCETMMRFGFSRSVSQAYIQQIADIIRPMNPLVIYLKNDEIRNTVIRTARQRPGWLEAVIAYHAHGAYGRRIGASGFDGYIRCLEERQRRELAILEHTGIENLVLFNPQRDWHAAQETVRTYLEEAYAGT